MHSSSPEGVNTPLAAVLREIGGAAELAEVTRIIRTAARTLTGAQGATFVLKQGDFVHYADEDAIGPLWKGRRFPKTACISGWVMMYRNPVVVEDVFHDPRIPVDVYEPTFVRSLAMVPIREEAPIAAIGIYWDHRHRATPQEVLVLQALATAAGQALARLNVPELSVS